jgi:hypothetical protein
MKLVPLVLCIVLLLAIATGCATGRHAASRSPSATTTTPAGVTFKQTGDAATPATSTTTNGRSSFTIPAGVPVSILPDGTAAFTTPEPVTFSASFDTLRATGPQAFTPPAPPTPTDEAAGRASLWFRLGLAAGAALGIFGLVKGWDAVALGGGAVAAACLVALSLAAIPVWVWIALGVGAAAIVGGPALWHLRIKHLTPPPAAAQTAPL